MLPTTKPYQDLLKNRVVYVLMGELFFIEEIRLSGMLATTKPYQDLLRNRIRKREEVDMEFYGTSAMTGKNWRKANQEQRQVVTRLHGFHHKLCRNKKFHKPTGDCECGLCEKKCERYHIVNCENRTKTITE